MALKKVLSRKKIHEKKKPYQSCTCPDHCFQLKHKDNITYFLEGDALRHIPNISTPTAHMVLRICTMHMQGSTLTRQMD